MAKKHRLVKDPGLVVPIETVLAETPWSKFHSVLVIGMRQNGTLYCAASHPGADALARDFLKQFKSGEFDN